MKDPYDDYQKLQGTIKKLEDKLRNLGSKSKSDLNTLVTDELKVIKEYESLAREKELEPKLLYQFFPGQKRFAGLISGQVVVSPFHYDPYYPRSIKGLHDEILRELEQKGRKLTQLYPQEVIQSMEINFISNPHLHIRGIRINLGHYVNNEKFRL